MNKLNFNQLFKEVLPDKINDNVFTLVGELFPVITAGNSMHYNSMVSSGGGMGILFKKPVIWSVLRSDRYTLELIREERTYTISYFPDNYKEQLIFLGSKSGKNSNKMQEVELTSIQTPLENITFEEARLIIECKLIQITTPNVSDFYTQEVQDYLTEAYKSPADIREYLFGEITHVWIKEQNECI